MKRYFQFSIALLSICCPRIATAIDETDSLDLLVTTLNSVDDVGVRHAVLRGMLSGLEGRRNIAAPTGWSKLSQKLAESEDKNVRELSAQLSQIFGDRKATAQALAMLTDRTGRSKHSTKIASLTVDSSERGSLVVTGIAAG